MNMKTIICGCEDGGDCTKMNICTATSFIDEMQERVDELEAQLEQVDLARKCLIYDNEKLQAKLDAVRGWQPIETAPKDELIDIWFKGKRVCDCYYDHRCSEWRTVQAGHLIMMSEKHATHWMPLPEPPKESKGLATTLRPRLPTGGKEMKALTPDDHVDASQCYDFYDTVLRYSSDAVLKYMQGLIIDEMNDRPQKKSKGEIAMDKFMKEAHEIAMDKFMKEAHEIAEGMEQLKNERVF